MFEEKPLFTWDEEEVSQEEEFLDPSSLPDQPSACSILDGECDACQ